MASGVRWYDHVLRREDGHVIIRALYLEVEEEGRRRKKGRPKRTRKVRLSKTV